MTPFPFSNTGYKPPVAKDPRNYKLESAQPAQPFPVSYKTDLSAIPVFQQWQLPDCVENAITFLKEYHEYLKTKIVPSLSRRSLAIPTVAADGFPFSEGTNVQNALKVAKAKGICEVQYLVDDHTLDENTFISAVLSPEAIQNAVTHEISNYAFLSDLSANGLKNAIYQNGLVVIGIDVDKNWWTATDGTISWAAADVLPIRPVNDPATKSGHAIVLYAYDDTYFYFMNSWSIGWGDNGHGWFGINDLPNIYEAAVVVDLTAAQIQAQQVTQVDVVNAIQQENNNPSAFEAKLASLLEWFVEQYNNLEATPEITAQHKTFLDYAQDYLAELKIKV